MRLRLAEKNREKILQWQKHARTTGLRPSLGREISPRCLTQNISSVCLSTWPRNQWMLLLSRRCGRRFIAKPSPQREVVWRPVQKLCNILHAPEIHKNWNDINIDIFVRVWRCAKGAAKWACGEAAVQTPKNGQQQAVNQNPQLDSPGKIHTYWIKATCDSKFFVLDVSEQKNVLFGAHRRIANARPLWLGQSYQGLKLCVSTLSSLFGTEHGALPWRQGWTPRNTAKRSALEMQGRNPQFAWTIFPDKKCTLQNLPMHSKKP